MSHHLLLCRYIDLGTTEQGGFGEVTAKPDRLVLKRQAQPQRSKNTHRQFE